MIGLCPLALSGNSPKVFVAHSDEMKAPTANGWGFVVSDCAQPSALLPVLCGEYKALYHPMSND